MTTWKHMMILSTCMLMLAACDKKAETTDAPDTGASAEEPAKDETKKPEAQEAPKAAGEVPVAEFSTKLADASCQWVTTCKNEELVQFLHFGAGMMLGFGAMGRPDLKSEIEPVMGYFKKAEEEKRVSLTLDECKTALGVAFKLGNMDGASLQKSIDAKRVTYDAKAAAQCIQGFSSEKTLCATETKVDLTQKSKPSAMMENEKKFKEGMEALTKSCDAVMAGQVEVDGECTETYECKGEAKCKRTADSTPEAPKKTCQAEAPKGGGAPPAK